VGGQDDVLPAHATRGKDGVTSDWMCMWRDGALGPGINTVACLFLSVLACASLAWPSEWEPVLAAGFLLLLGADWSGALVSPEVAGPWRSIWYSLTQLCWGRVGGALASWGPIVQLARSADVTTSHTTTTDGVVGGGAFRCGFSERRRGYPVGRIEPRGGDGLRCCFGMFRVQMG
jgi:hypothetical protein